MSRAPAGGANGPPPRTDCPGRAYAGIAHLDNPQGDGRFRAPWPQNRTFADPLIRCIIGPLLNAARRSPVSLALKVARIEAVTPRIKSVELVAAARGALPGFTAGAPIDTPPAHAAGAAHSSRS